MGLGEKAVRHGPSRWGQKGGRRRKKGKGYARSLFHKNFARENPNKHCQQLEGRRNGKTTNTQKKEKKGSVVFCRIPEGGPRCSTRKGKKDPVAKGREGRLLSDSKKKEEREEPILEGKYGKGGFQKEGVCYPGKKKKYRQHPSELRKKKEKRGLGNVCLWRP